MDLLGPSLQTRDLMKALGMDGSEPGPLSHTDIDMGYY